MTTPFRTLSINATTRNPSQWQWKREHRDIIIKSPYEGDGEYKVPVWDLLGIKAREWFELEETEFPITNQDVDDYIKTHIIGSRARTRY